MNRRKEAFGSGADSAPDLVVRGEWLGVRGLFGMLASVPEVFSFRLRLSESKNLLPLTANLLEGARAKGQGAGGLLGMLASVPGVFSFRLRLSEAKNLLPLTANLLEGARGKGQGAGGLFLAAGILLPLAHCPLPLKGLELCSFTSYPSLLPFPLPCRTSPKASSWRKVASVPQCLPQQQPARQPRRQEKPKRTGSPSAHSSSHE